MNKVKKVLVVSLSVIAWLLIWELGASVVNNVVFFSGVAETFKALASLVATSSFWKTVFFSMMRIALGFALGVVIGVLLAFICAKSDILCTFFSLGIGVIKATPVASIIMILWGNRCLFYCATAVGEGDLCASRILQHQRIL